MAKLFGARELLNRAKDNYQEIKSETALKKKGYATSKLIGNVALLSASVSAKVATEVIKRAPAVIISQANSTIKESRSSIENTNITREQRENLQRKISDAEELKRKAEEYKSKYSQ